MVLHNHCLNQTQTLSGIETGLLQFYVWGCRVSTKPKPSQGLKRDGAYSGNAANTVVSTKPKPSQGLKLPAEQRIGHAVISGLNQTQTLSGIETLIH